MSKEYSGHSTGTLLGVDLGLRTGFALYGRDGRLSWYHSRHFANPNSLRRRLRRLLGEISDLKVIVIEGGGNLARIWEREAGRRGISVITVGADEWRQVMFYPREGRTSLRAKRAAGQLARRVIEWSGLQRPTSLRHDAAEAILIGLWGAVHLGWLRSIPDKISLKGLPGC